MDDVQKPEGSADLRPFRPKGLTTNDIREGCIKLYGNDGVEAQLCVINEELRQGLDFVEKYEKSITIFGSARTPEGNKYYEKARRIAYRAAKELGYAVVTGGGPGIMEAGNRGAYEANGTSLGLSIQLPHEQLSNKYLTEDIPFYFFFTRKTAMRYGSEVYLFFPGGFGTLDEMFETLTLVQTHKIAPVPVIMVGEEYWKPLDQFIKQDLQEEHMIGESDPSLYIITDDEDKILEIIKNAPLRHDN
jgi:uncharacterized protein (TIGR00730 family)